MWNIYVKNYVIMSLRTFLSAVGNVHIGLCQSEVPSVCDAVGLASGGIQHHVEVLYQQSMKVCRVTHHKHFEK